MVGPDEEAKESESTEDEDVEEFETVEEEDVGEDVEEFEGFDENAPDEIKTSGFKTKGGEIPDYEPTVDEVLSYAMGKTKDPTEPAPASETETPMGESLSHILTKVHETEEEDEGEEAEGEEADEEEGKDDEPPGLDDSLDELLDEVESAFGTEGDEEEDEEEDEGEEEEKE